LLATLERIEERPAGAVPCDHDPLPRHALPLQGAHRL
jgi:hypothetical protein